MASKKNVTLVSPEGIAVYPWLKKADYKFKAEGEFRTKLRIPGEEAQGFIEKIYGIHKAFVQEETKRLKKKVKEATMPWTEVFDDEGNETGDIEFNFKRKAQVTMKDGSTFNTSVKVFDSQNKELPEEVNVYGGSIIKVASEIVPYHTPALGCGISLRLQAVQVKKLVEGGGSSGNASAYGFDADDGGYVAPSATPVATFEDSNEDPDDF